MLGSDGADADLLSGKAAEAKASVSGRRLSGPWVGPVLGNIPSAADRVVPRERQTPGLGESAGPPKWTRLCEAGARSGISPVRVGADASETPSVEAAGMTAEVLIYASSAVLVVWGVMHLNATRNVVRGFGEITSDNTHIITMEWIAEGLTHVFVGLLAVLTTAVAGADTSASDVVYRASAALLITIGVLALFTGARVPVIWFKLCPPLIAAVATALVVASIL